MKILAKILAMFCITSFAFAQTIEVKAGVAGEDLVDALAYVNGGGAADTLLLVTDGGIYEFSTGDTISVPIIISAAAGLTNMPIIRASAGDTVETVFEVWADFTVEGIIFDGKRTDGTLNPFLSKDVIGVVPHPDGTFPRHDITIRDCEFHNIYQNAAPETDNAGNAFRVRTDALLGNLLIEGVLFENIIDEAILMQKVSGMSVHERVADTVIVRNSTFINCAGPKNQACITFKGDEVLATVDAKIYLENLTFYNSGPNCIYAREIEGMVVRNIVIANTHATGDNDNLIKIDRDGSAISHIDTFMIGPLLKSDALAVGPGQNTGAGMATLDTTTIYGFDPAFTDTNAASLDLTLLATSEILTLGSDGFALGDARWDPNAIVAVEDDLHVMPSAFALAQNYPNPFNPTTTVNFTLENRSVVSLVVYDLTGSEVATLVDGVKSIGSHSVVWNGSGAPSGIYFCRLTANGQSETRKMLLLK